MDIMIKLPDTFEIAARGETLELNVTALSADILAQAVLHGLKQTVADAASAAASGAYETQRGAGEADWKALGAEEKKAWSSANVSRIVEHSRVLMLKRMDALKEGDWQTRASAAPGLSQFDEYIGELVAGKLSFAKGTRKPEKVEAGLAKYATLDADTQAKVKQLVKARIERERAERALDIDLGF